MKYIQLSKRKNDLKIRKCPYIKQDAQKGNALFITVVELSEVRDWITEEQLPNYMKR